MSKSKLIAVTMLLLALSLATLPSNAAPVRQIGGQATATPEDGNFGGGNGNPGSGQMPPADPAFSRPVELGVDENTTYWPHWAVSSNPNYSRTLTIFWLQNQQHVLTRTSVDVGTTFSPTGVFAGTAAWGGAVGNLSVTGDNNGLASACWYQLYGYAYPSIYCRQIYNDGKWGMERQVPGSNTERMKVGVPAPDWRSDLHLLVGRGSKSLFYVGTHEGTEWTDEYAMPITLTSHPNPTFLPASLILQHGGGGMLTAWGDARADDGTWKLFTAFSQPQAYVSPTSNWSTHYFTETLAGGGYQNGYGQYRPAMTELKDGGVGLVFECRPTEAPARDICYREWQPRFAGEPTRGWLTSTVTIAHTWPETSEAPSIAVDPASGQRYACWQDTFDNLVIVCSWSASGKASQWSPPVRVNGGSHVREKMVSIAVAGGRLHVAWVDNRGSDRGMAVYYSSRPLPAPYPAQP